MRLIAKAVDFGVQMKSDDYLNSFKACNDQFLYNICDGPIPPCDTNCPWYEEEHDMGATIPFCRIVGDDPINGWDCLKCKGVTKEEWKRQEREKKGIPELNMDAALVALIFWAILLDKDKEIENGD